MTSKDPAPLGRMKLFSVLKAARTSPLDAMDLLPAGADVSTIGPGPVNGALPFRVAQSYASAHHVLVADAESYRKPKMIRQVIADGMGENLFTKEGEEWLARRRPVAPVFGLQNVEALASLMLDTVEEVTDSWDSGTLDIQEAMTDLTVRVALRGLLGADDGTEALAADVRRAFDEILQWVSYRFNQPLSPPLVVPTPRNRRLRQAKSDLHGAIRALMEHRRQQEPASFDILGQLLMAQRDSADELTDEAIAHECAGFMFAGHETTASTLTWALYELSLRPDLQSRVAAEGDELVKTTSTFDALSAMSDTADVMRETLRMYPAGISIVRSAKRSTELAGHKIRRGTMVMIPVYAIQRSGETCEDPNTFDSGRAHDLDSSGYLPFGLGPRRCLGARFARTELQIAIGRICAKWALAYGGNTRPRPIVAPSLRAEGTLPLTITSRSV